MVKARISLEDMRALVFPIIPYQVITGNYDKPVSNQDGIIHLSYTIYVVG